ncbi:MAG: hypothetical protein ACYYKD_12950 [Rhodospirillales bacterium]
MLGAVVGDIAAGPFLDQPGPVPADCVIWREGARVTGAAVGVIAVADALIDSAEDFAPYLQKWARAYPEKPYPAGEQNGGPAFAAVRGAPVAWAAESPADVMRLAARQAGNVESAKAAVALASACYMALQGAGRRIVRDWVEERFGYNMHARYDALVTEAETNVGAPGGAHAGAAPGDAVRLGFISALWAENTEGAVKNALRLGGGAACGPRAMAAGALAQALYGLESLHQNHALDALEGEMESTALVFRAQY